MARQLQTGGRRCMGAYANTLLTLAPTVSRYEQQPGRSFVYCLRSTAVYEQVYYGRDGKLKHRYLKALAHGTGFAYRWTGLETLLLTNHHVASWPEVTDDDNAVSGVPVGAKKVSELLQIVRNDEDDYEPGFVTLTRMVTDPSLDASVVKAKTRLNIMPYVVGSSAELHAGNAVEVRGYPLGAFAAANVGKVTNPYVEDLDGNWSHADFALDARVNRGNSGSPVLAVSCLTGEYELVGLFHAGYREGEAMNLAVGVDELKPLMEKLTPRARPQRVEATTMTLEARRALSTLLTGHNGLLHMRFGNRMAEVELTPADGFSFRLYGENYPADPHVYVQLDEPVQDDDNPPHVSVSRALDPPWSVPAEALNAEAREHLQRMMTALLTRLARMQQYREVAGEPPRSMTQHKRADRLLKEMVRMEKEQQEMLEVLDTHLERARNALLMRDEAVSRPDAPRTEEAPGEQSSIPVIVPPAPPTHGP
jgi:serine protease Do